jgi:hypothetical protein
MKRLLFFLLLFSSALLQAQGKVLIGDTVGKTVSREKSTRKWCDTAEYSFPAYWNDLDSARSYAKQLPEGSEYGYGSFNNLNAYTLPGLTLDSPAITLDSANYGRTWWAPGHDLQLIGVVGEPKDASPKKKPRGKSTKKHRYPPANYSSSLGVYHEQEAPAYSHDADTLTIADNVQFLRICGEVFWLKKTYSGNHLYKVELEPYREGMEYYTSSYVYQQGYLIPEKWKIFTVNGCRASEWQSLDEKYGLVTTGAAGYYSAGKGWAKRNRKPRKKH